MTGGIALLGDDHRPGEEEVPGAVPAVAVSAGDGLAVAHPVAVPGGQRQPIVMSHVLAAVDLEVGFLHRLEHGGCRQTRVRAGENVTVHEQAPDEVLGVHGLAQSRPLEKENSVVIQHPVNLIIEGLEVLDPHVLDHLDAGDLVVLLLGDVAIIHAEDLAAVRGAILLDLPHAVLRLVLGQRHARGDRPVMLGGVPRERAPAAANVQKGIARLELQLLADQVELIVLGLLQRFGGVLEEGARVDHPFAQEPAEEVVAPVVVLAHDARILLFGVNRDFGDEVRDGPLEMAPRELVLDELVAVLQEIRDVAADIELAREIRLIKRLHRNFSATAALFEVLVLEFDEVRNFCHGVPFGYSCFRGMKIGGYGSTSQSQTDYFFVSSSSSLSATTSRLLEPLHPNQRLEVRGVWKHVEKLRPSQPVGARKFFQIHRQRLDRAAGVKKMGRLEPLDQAVTFSQAPARRIGQNQLGLELLKFLRCLRGVSGAELKLREPELARGLIGRAHRLLVDFDSQQLSPSPGGQKAEGALAAEKLEDPGRRRLADPVSGRRVELLGHLRVGLHECLGRELEAVGADRVVDRAALREVELLGPFEDRMGHGLEIGRDADERREHPLQLRQPLLEPRDALARAQHEAQILLVGPWRMKEDQPLELPLALLDPIGSQPELPDKIRHRADQLIEPGMMDRAIQQLTPFVQAAQARRSRKSR